MRRMVQTLRILLTSFPVMASLISFSQSDKICKPPIGRALWHDRIDREQRNALKADGKADQVFYTGPNEDINYYVTQALVRRIDGIQCKIESDSLLGDQKKKGYLLGVERILKSFTAGYRNRQFTPSRLPTLLDAFEQAMEKDKKGESIEPLIQENAYEVSKVLVACQAFDRNPGIKNAQNILLLKYCILHPDKVFLTLKDNPDVPFRDSLIKLAGYRNPRYLYDFAAANNRLGYAIRKIDDPFIQTVSKMATSGGSGQLYFPFLDNLIKGKMKLSDIDAVKADDAKYYKLLVKTRMDYVQRTLEGEKILEMESLSRMMEKKGNEVYTKEINGLHESPDAVRFKILYTLTPQELYYLVIAGETELYTSSYVKGIYPIMMQKIGNKGDSLLMSVGFDRFKKFIKMAAGYNTLSDFLNTFPDKKQAQVLMTAFVNNLEKSEGLEDGVDVADSYASIQESIKPVAEQMLNNVKLNYDRNVAAGNKRGMVIYNLLDKLFRSSSDSTVNLSQEFGIPPVYSVSYESLVTDSAHEVVTQVFFYGDEDGRMNYSRFTPQFSNGNWKKIQDNKYWIAFASTKGKPIVIYANKPLDELSGELDKAQESLNNYLASKSIEPTIVVHRGHSYYAPYTIQQIQPAAKIVFLGSCGGYHLIHDVLSHAPEAHIIASKQIGKQVINQPFMDLLNEKLRVGSNVDWMPFWNEFRAKAGKVDGFDDYIPPYKNLGAIFIKAYKIAMGDESDD
ncbi:hypothetical protein SAMN02745131_03221 [Flavisolibacter ginsengisoli DSM 18119]|uniref:Uncharacterized protein n=2 Tax=Flavisolibacter TaxID=398041 RepID=A0A1M5DH79_9BACT|nr:hypothetical protein SAMN02745131_03221 [Flavisolibacter ginsengisoli DSM 18119]